MSGEDKIMEAMMRFGNDSRCLTALKGMKGEAMDSLNAYKKALVELEKKEVIEK